ncbi:MAG: hypothetical protein V4664_01245 [Patescibacteria group bacterium]
MSTVYPQFKKIVSGATFIAVLFIVAVFFVPSVSFASFVENFDSYSNGVVFNTVSVPYTSDDDSTVSTAAAQDGSLYGLNRTGNVGYFNLSTQLATTGVAYWSFWLKSLGSTDGFTLVPFYGTSDISCNINKPIFSSQIQFNSGSDPVVLTSDGGNWHYYTVFFDSTNNVCKARVDGGSWTVTKTYTNNNFNSLTLSGFGDFYFDSLSIYDTDAPDGNSNTRFLSIAPYSTTTASTTVNLNTGIYYNGADGYSHYFDEVCNDLDYIEREFTQINFSTEAPHNCAPITASGESGISFSEILAPGAWSSIWYFHSSLDGSKAYATSTAFIVQTSSHPTSWFTRNADGTYKFSTSSATSTLSDLTLQSCAIGFSFNWSECFAGLFGWQSLAMKSGFEQLKNGFLSIAPFGYVTRTMIILNSQATTTLPVLSYTFPSNYSISFFQNQTFSFDIFQYFFQTGNLIHTIESTGSDPKDIWEITEPWFKLLLYLSLLFLIVGDLLQLNIAFYQSVVDENGKKETLKERFYRRNNMRKK